MVCYRLLHQEDQVHEALYRQTGAASQALLLLGVFNHLSTCWRANTAGHKQSWRFLKVHKSIGPDELHLWDLRELLDQVIEPLSIILEKTYQSMEVPAEQKRGNITPFLKRKRRKTEKVSLT